MLTPESQSHNQERLAYFPHVDERDIDRRAAYQAKLRNHIRDKGIQMEA